MSPEGYSDSFYLNSWVIRKPQYDYCDKWVFEYIFIFPRTIIICLFSQKEIKRPLFRRSFLNVPSPHNSFMIELKIKVNETILGNSFYYYLIQTPQSPFFLAVQLQLLGAVVGKRKGGWHQLRQSIKVTISSLSPNLVLTLVFKPTLSLH